MPLIKGKSKDSVGKNIIAQICWIISELKRIWDEINKIWRAIDDIKGMLNKLCKIIANMSNPKLQTLLFTKTSKVSTDTEGLGSLISNPAVMQSVGVGIAWARLDKPSCEGGNDGYYEWLFPIVLVIAIIIYFLVVSLLFSSASCAFNALCAA